MSIIVRDKDGNRKKIAGAGLPGPVGKSAYQYAVEGGFTGSETEFSALLGQRSNPNLLDNWYFPSPVNQRGQLEYTGTGYTIDRWHAFGNTKVVLSSDGLVLSMPGGLCHLRQFLDMDAGWFHGKQFTLSVLTNDSFYSVCFTAPTGEIYIRTKEDVIVHFMVPTTGYPYVRIFNSEEKVIQNFTVKAVKLELGSVQTLAHQDASGSWVLNDPPPDPALELAKCQRYYQEIDNVDALVGSNVLGDQRLSNSIFFNTMRSAPSVSLEEQGGGIGVIQGERYLTKSEISYVFIGKSNLTIATTSADTAGKVISIFKIKLDANL